MKIKKAAALPLITVDPYFSIWSKYDNLNDGATTHWCGKNHSLNGIIQIGKTMYSFLGDGGVLPKLKQVETALTATTTSFKFKNKEVKLKVSFNTPLLLDDPYLVSRPCSYIDFELENKNKEDVKIYLFAGADIVRSDNSPVLGGVNKLGKINYGLMGKTLQTPLGGSGDNVTVNWGYLYLATKDGKVSFSDDKEELSAELNMSKKTSATVVLAFDDLLSINYFGEFYKGLWTKKYANILEAIKASFEEHKELLNRCAAFDKDLEAKAKEIAGEDYAFICNLSYRHSISAHKLIEDNKGRLIFLSKENDSNGCLGTADVSYPSIPLYLLHGTEYVKGLVRPIMDFAACDVWEFDFAPHDVGRYPYAWGQVYGVKRDTNEMNLGKNWSYQGDNIFPPYYLLSSGSDVYEHKYQMPVEECGNMIIMIYNVCRMDKSGEFAREYMETLKIWVNYLVKYGADPEDQLCTDDFAGHLAHNVNLSIKAVMGIEAYALLAQILGDEAEYKKFHKLAEAMAKSIEERATEGDHTRLTYDGENTWSLKYNLIWDEIWGTGLFSEDLGERETEYYVNKINEFGVPLDSRQDYTKSDWILWCASMAKDEEIKKALIAPIAHYAVNTPTRIAFGDWYDTVTGKYCQFIARSVQGGIFMPMLYNLMK